MVPGHDVALEAEGLGAQRRPVGQGLVDRVEVVERAPESLDEEEDEGDDQEGEDHQDAAAGLAPRRGGTAGPRRTSDVGGLGGGLGSVVVSGHDRSPRGERRSPSATGVSDILSARSQRRRRRTRLTA